MKHFLDIGGHHGETFDFLRSRCRDYDVFWIFEPSPRHFATLLSRCKNMARKHDVRVCPFGIGGFTSIRRFYEKDDPMGDSFCTWTASDHETRNINSGYALYASVVALTDFILAFTEPFDTITLDIDAEGAEYEILDSLVRCRTAWRRIAEVMVEWHQIRGERRILPREFERICTDSMVKLTHRGTDALLVDQRTATGS